MKIVFTSDLHVHEWNEHATLIEGFNSRLTDCVCVLSEIRTYCTTHGIKRVVVAGDFFHKKSVIFTRPYNLVVAELAYMKAAGLEVYAVDGNHDHATKDGSVHVVQALQDAGLVVASPPAYQGWTNVKLGENVVLSLFSYCDGRDKLTDRLDQAEKDLGSSSPHRIGVFHHGFLGAKVGVLEYVVKEEIDPELLRGFDFDLILSGHYHTRQQIGKLGHAWYIGSPLQHTRSDAGIEDKGFMVYDTKTREIEVVPVHRPQFITASWETWEEDAERVEGNFVDITYSGDEDPEVVRKGVLAAGARSVKLMPLVKAKVSTTRLEVDPSLDPGTVIQRYVTYKKEEVDRHGLDPAKVAALGTDLLSKAH